MTRSRLGNLGMEPAGHHVAFCLDCGQGPIVGETCSFEFCVALWGFAVDEDGDVFDEWVGDPPGVIP